MAVVFGGDISWNGRVQMKQSRFSETQIVEILTKREGGFR